MVLESVAGEEILARLVREVHGTRACCRVAAVGHDRGHVRVAVLLQLVAAHPTDELEGLDDLYLVAGEVVLGATPKEPRGWLFGGRKSDHKRGRTKEGRAPLKKRVHG
jgi:hypothetical protein